MSPAVYPRRVKRHRGHLYTLAPPAYTSGMNATAAARTTLTRADSPKGQYVTVSWTDGTTSTGTLLAWGGWNLVLAVADPVPHIERRSGQEISTVTGAVR